MERRLCLPFEAGFEDGLGEYYGGAFQTPAGRYFALIQYRGAPGMASTLIQCLRDCHFADDLDPVLESLDLDLSDLVVINSKLAIDDAVKLIPHTLYRQDDNGVRAIVGVFPCRADATKKMRAFEAAGHKQGYWVEACGVTPLAAA
jgi:hypothetical protein